MSVPNALGRQQWLSALARAPGERLNDLASPWVSNMAFEWLRRPEVGLYLAQGRIDAEGDRFNLADVTVTRCVIRSTHQTVGVGYVMGRDHEKARTVACLDALLQVDAQRDGLIEAVVAPLIEEEAARRTQQHQAAQQSRVQFYTLTPDTSAAPMRPQT